MACVMMNKSPKKSCKCLTVVSCVCEGSGEEEGEGWEGGGKRKEQGKRG